MTLKVRCSKKGKVILWYSKHSTQIVSAWSCWWCFVVWKIRQPLVICMNDRKQSKCKDPGQHVIGLEPYSLRRSALPPNLQRQLRWLRSISPLYKAKASAPIILLVAPIDWCTDGPGAMAATWVYTIGVNSKMSQISFFILICVRKTHQVEWIVGGT